MRKEKTMEDFEVSKTGTARMMEKLAWVRAIASLSLPYIQDADARARLEAAIKETAPGLVDLARVTVEDLRAIERDCAMAKPQAMGRGHLSFEEGQGHD